MEPPTYPGEAAPARCTAKEECPPDFPGCGAGAKRGNKDWGVACDNSTECKVGLLCNDGTCETAPSCETNADCQSGVCTDNKCSVGDESGSVSPSSYKKNWLGLHFAQDIAIIGGSDVCSGPSRAENGYACYEAGSSTVPYNGDPYPGAGIATGTVLATRRLLLSFDRALTPNITLGARVGLAIGGGPPAGKGPDAENRPRDQNNNPITSAGTAFLPFHGELRLAYWFGKGVLGKKGFRPYIHVGGGVAQVDAKVKVTVQDCPPGLPDLQYNACVLGKSSSGSVTKELDAWRKMGQGFITAGGGAVYAIKENFGVQLNFNFMYMLPTSGPVLQPSLGVVYGF